jgi:PadR family transcriptional regulator, regulatory protein PadR
MRGAGPVAVLKLLEQHEMYGYELVELLTERSNGILGMGQSTLYPMLYNLESKGFIEANWRTGSTGRERKYYRLTPKGMQELALRTQQWHAVTAAMQSIGVLPDPQQVLPGNQGAA